MQTKRRKIETKSVRSPREPKRDGLRLLVTRFRGRGLAKTSYDVWMPNLAPAEKVLRAFQTGKIDWRTFGRLYHAGLWESTSTDRANRTIRNHGQKFTLRLIQHLAARETVTLLCHCAEDEPHCHRHLLRRWLQGTI